MSDLAWALFGVAAVFLMLLSILVHSWLLAASAVALLAGLYLELT